MITKRIRQRNFWIMITGDAVLIFLAYFFSYIIRFDLAIIPTEHLGTFLATVYWIIPVKLTGFYLFALYRGMWRYTSLQDLFNITKACLVTSTVIVLIIFASHSFVGFSRSVFFIDLLLTFLFISAYRVWVRFIYSRQGDIAVPNLFSRNDAPQKRLCIVGAGDAGEKLLREIIDNPKLKYNVVGFIDDHPGKLGNTIHRVPVLGPIQDLKDIVLAQDIEEIIIAVPSATAMEMRRIVEHCKGAGVAFKTLPGFGELVEGKVTVSAIREVQYTDLLGRAPVKLALDQIGEYLSGKRVLVTGAAGSIGSELCRQIAKFNPGKIILVERNESGLYDIDMNLKLAHPGLSTESVLGAVQNRARMARVFFEHRPHTVFHAAAYKHVPMMEAHPWEAVFNNVLGSQTIIDLCEQAGVGRCVIVSTDKAVRPTNVMGATKRMVERLTQCYAAGSRCLFMAVRFGNVLGSSGSVLPVFKRQIAVGGPVTVTHPEVTRYFMTIPEACSLILQAGAIGSGNEIFVLKMGTPVRIDNMARDLITLSGFTPDLDIAVEYTGLRPGEKLYEELITDEEDIQLTIHEDIMVLRGNGCLPKKVMMQHLQELVGYARKQDGDKIREKLFEVVPEYCIQKPEETVGNVIPLQRRAVAG